jgi:hypothetical protein
MEIDVVNGEGFRDGERERRAKDDESYIWSMSTVFESGNEAARRWANKRDCNGPIEYESHEHVRVASMGQCLVTVQESLERLGMAVVIDEERCIALNRW